MPLILKNFLARGEINVASSIEFMSIVYWVPITTFPTGRNLRKSGFGVF
jgi:hypothetical protein